LRSASDFKPLISKTWPIGLKFAHVRDTYLSLPGNKHMETHFLYSFPEHWIQLPTFCADANHGPIFQSVNPLWQAA
jgi:hypothetical protein